MNRIGFPPPWTVERIEGGYKVLDATGQALAYVYGTVGDVSVGKTLTRDEARRIASNIAKLPGLLAGKIIGSIGSPRGRRVQKRRPPY